MKLYLLVALFGAAGSILRYSLYLITPRFFYLNFPVSTVLVNLLGSFFIGACISLFDKSIITENTRIYITIGLLGGFTTFSTFSMDLFNLLNKSLYIEMISYLVLSVFGGLLLFLAGYKIVSFF
ncbi:fluoride efflux transporter CrcB [Pelagibacteraceae bacterium]|jgi:CrcB protein|nr:fluoride efflux transporter CrcB [Pelagibacteraceae bacterium]